MNSRVNPEVWYTSKRAKYYTKLKINYLVVMLPISRCHHFWGKQPRMKSLKTCMTSKYLGLSFKEQGHLQNFVKLFYCLQKVFLFFWSLKKKSGTCRVTGRQEHCHCHFAAKTVMQEGELQKFLQTRKTGKH